MMMMIYLIQIFITHHNNVYRNAVYKQFPSHSKCFLKAVIVAERLTKSVDCYEGQITYSSGVNVWDKMLSQPLSNTLSIHSLLQWNFVTLWRFDTGNLLG